MRRRLAALLVVVVASASAALVRSLKTPSATPTRQTSRSTAPQMMPAAVLIPAAAGGTFAGGLHAVTGPDHLAALLPLCVGRRWYKAASTGAFWGLGHGVGAALVGLLAFALRGALNLHVLSPYMEAAVGTSIIVIGATGYREARDWASSAEQCPIPGVPDDRPAAEIVETSHVCDAPPPQDVSRTLLNGVLNGVSGTGHILGVLPALAMPSWAVASVYLSCFGLGTLLAMALFTGVVGELSSQLASYTPAAPAASAMAASLFALVMGSMWTVRALVALGLLPAIAALLG